MRRYRDNKDILIIQDLQDKVWRDLVDKCEFSEFTEVYSDRSYLFMYISRWVEEYISIYERYKDDDSIKVVIYDGSYLDILIYSLLHMWFHYPAKDIQGKMISRLLSMEGTLDKIYMVRPNDELYPVERGALTLRQRMADFNRTRIMETSLYDTYRKREDVEDLSDDQVVSESMIIDILRKDYGIEI